MDKQTMILEILSPEKIIFTGEVSRVALPGSMSPFVVLYNHAPMISSLTEGNVSWIAADNEQSVKVTGGFAEIKDNCITVCVEVVE